MQNGISINPLWIGDIRILYLGRVICNNNKPRELREHPTGAILSQALEIRKVQRLSCKGVHSSEWKCEAPQY